MRSDAELLDLAHDLYQRLGGIGSKDARVVRALWERWEFARKPGPATEELVELIRSCLDVAGVGEVYIDEDLGRRIYAEWTGDMTVFGDPINETSRPEAAKEGDGE